MKIFNLSLAILAFVILSSLATIKAQAQGKLYTVNDAGDSFDANVGDRICADANGKCTLRAAIQESNATCCDNAVYFILPASSVINLTLGELQITRWVSVIGPGAKNLTIQRSTASGTPNFRIFHIATGQTWRSFLRGFRIKNGVATTGGGIYVESSGVVRIADVAFTNNTANRGGAIFNEGKISLSRSLVQSNSADNAQGTAGGGIYNSGTQATAYLINSTLTENNSVSGGAVFNEGNLVVINNTISHNSASVAGSSVFNAAGGTASFINTITGMDNSAISSLSGAFTSLGNNLITDARNSTGFTNGANGDQVSDNNVINPLLGDLADNGGETETRALLAGSPAINHANNCVTNASCPNPYPYQSGFHLITDQRPNHLRKSSDTVDVGAVEFDTQVFVRSGSLGTYFINPREGSCLLQLTNATTSQKQHRISNPYGNYEFNGLPTGYAYILERQCKRAFTGGVAVYDFEIYPF